MKSVKFRDMNLFAKLLVFASTIFLPSVILIIVYLLPYFTNQLYNSRKESLKELVETSISLMKEYDNKYKSDELTLEEAQQKYISHIKNLRYNKEDYFWINDLEPKMIMHPFKPQLNGQSVAENKDSEGKKLFIEMVNVCKKDGKGFVDYMWPKPGFEKPVPKISYVELYEPWNWIVGTGIYVDDLVQLKSEIQNRIIIILFCLFGFTFLVSVFIAKKITNPVKLLNDAAIELSNGNFNISLNVNSNDEIGKMQKAFNLMVEKIN